MSELRTIDGNKTNDGIDASSPIQVNCSNVSASMAGDETPPRRSGPTETITATTGMPPSTPSSSSPSPSPWEPRSINRRNNNRSGIAYPRAKSNGSTRSKNEESITSSVFSVASGLVLLEPGREDLEGLIVQTTSSQEGDADESTVPMESSSKEKSQIGQLQILLTDLKNHLDRTMIELRDQSRRDFEKVLAILQQESAKRTDLEQRLHSQLLLQSETMVAMELKLLRLEAKVERREAALRQQRRAPSVSIMEETAAELGIRRPATRSIVGPANMAVITSGASLASGVTAGSFLVDGEDSTDKNSDADGDVEDEGEDEGDTQVTPVENVNFDESHSTPTQGSRFRPQFTGETLDSILLNPMLGETGLLGTSTRATRGERDGNSSLATSVTNSTITSTVVTATTRGDSVNYRTNRFLQDPEVAVEVPDARLHSALRGDPTFGAPQVDDLQLPRSRSQSPLTVQSSTIASEAPSVASASAGTAILSTAAVAPSRAFGTRRAAAAAAGASQLENRPIANRVVSFTTDILNQTNQFSEAGDSITMPDEIDNLSDIADAFAASSRTWREEYEARLDALQKRWAAE